MLAIAIRRFLACCAALALAPIIEAAAAEEPPLATEQEVIDAYAVLQEWTEAYRSGDYDAQWRLTDSRIRYWHDKKRWKKWMTKAQRRNGDLLSYVVEYGAPVRGEQLPCTENGHCFRRGVQYIMYVMQTQYEKATPVQPEYAVLAKSDEGWRFGGGAFLNRPMGETSVIMTRQDEERYRPGVSIKQ